VSTYNEYKSEQNKEKGIVDLVCYSNNLIPYFVSSRHRPPVEIPCLCCIDSRHERANGAD